MKTSDILSERPDVVECIDSELEYQNLIAEQWADSEDNGVAGQILTLEEYTQEARKSWVRNSGEQEALKNLRKCAAIAIRALINYGALNRSLNERSLRENLRA